MKFQGTPSYIISKKLQNLKFFLKNWSKTTYGKISENKAQPTAQIDDLNAMEEFSTLSDTQFIERVELRAKLKQINLDNARKWLVRSMTQHFKEADANTKFFHSLANGRRRRNTIQKLIINGEDNFSLGDISDEISRYFYKLFQDDHTLRPQIEEKYFTKITDQESRSLEREITEDEDEAWKIIKNFKNNKSSGPDRYNMDLFKVV
ncbi:uncharacterized protein LOC113291006 [Papaver somniferum]|uniref:uncharacterized protein LOC113291006 n=1 Tax=Papaver somniferum TaxID=3469 RepID=UPI000E6F7676|nr:uncharacterized protein LOC113291006 [Papaver somniferum]